MLVKFCKPEHNLSLGCNTVRFGTLEYYRNLDPSFLIADSEEGIDNHEVNHIGGIPSDRECIEFLDSTGFFTPDMTVLNINFRRTYPNCYIWCCKIMDSEPNQDNGLQFNPDYSSFYKIDDRNKFSVFLANLLCQSIKIENFSESTNKIIHDIPILDLQGISLMTYHGPVTYIEKKEGKLTFGKFQSYAEKVPLPLRHLFVKTNKYVDDNEYRFAFMFGHKQSNVALSVKEDPVDIQTLPISK